MYHYPLTTSLITLVLQWVLFSVAAALSALRYARRRSHGGSLELDDWLHMVALLILLAFSVMNLTKQYNDVWVTFASPKSTRGALNFMENILIARQFFMWGTIFAVKAVFLVLYKKIFGISRTFMVCWWLLACAVALAFTMQALGIFLACGYGFGGYNTGCTGGSTDRELKYTANRFILLNVLPNTLTDVALMTLPIFMLFRVKISGSRKLRTAPVFLLSMVVIIFDAIGWSLEDAFNTVEKLPEGKFRAKIVGQTLLTLEPSVAVIIATLPIILFGGRASRRSQDGASAEQALSPIQPDNRE